MGEEQQLGPFWRELQEEHARCSSTWQLRRRTEKWLQGLLAALFPQFWSEELGPCERLNPLVEHLTTELACLIEMAGAQPSLAGPAFWRQTPAVRKNLMADAAAMERHDPAAQSVEEVLLAYPGFLALAVHRLAHLLHLQAVPLVPRLMSEWAHRETGIDIHPGASIGVPFVMDHGTGIVIGETTQIGSGVKLYQGVTLGALSVNKDLAEKKRHPTIENDVVVYAGATLLGGRTVIGAGSIIAGGAFLTASVPPGSLVTRANEVRPIRSSPTEFLAFGEGI